MADNKFALKVMCPDRTFFEGEADMVEMNTTEDISEYIRDIYR